ncbi:creatininase family protein [soil metagenome]
MSSRELHELPGPALASALTADSIIVLPTGSIEHHGPHLPLATDLILADLMSSRIVDAAVAAGLDVWRLAPLAYTKSDEHHWAPGTMWVSWDTLMRTLVDIGRSVANTPARTLVFYNGHGGNTALLMVALRELHIQFGLRTFLMNAGMPAGDGVNGPDERGFGIHGGHGETSMVMALRPELVDVSLASRWVPDAIADFEHVKFNGGSVAFGWQSDDFGPSGVIGDPTEASAAWGAHLVETSTAQGVAELAEIARFNK